MWWSVICSPRGKQRWRSSVTVLGLLALGCDFHHIDLLPVTNVAAAGGTSPSPPDSSGGTGGSSSGGATGGQGEGAEGGMGGVPEPPPPAPVRVLMVVDDLPISTDDAIESRLAGLKLDGEIEVVRLAEAMTTPADAEGFDVVIVSSSADSAGIGGSLKDIPVPMLVLEPSIFQLMGLGPGRSSSGDSQMTIEDEAHPIAHGQSGTLTICGGMPMMVGQQVQPSGVLVAQAVNNTNLGVIVAYEAGVDVGGALPERRVSFGALKLASCQSETSWQFFDAAVRWLVRQSE